MSQPAELTVSEIVSAIMQLAEEEVIEVVEELVRALCRTDSGLAEEVVGAAASGLEPAPEPDDED